MSNDHDHRSLDQGGYMGRGGKSLAADLPVEQTHNALDHRDVGRFWRSSAVQQQRRQLVLAARIGVEVAPEATGRQRVVARVDVVRARP